MAEKGIRAENECLLPRGSFTATAKILSPKGAEGSWCGLLFGADPELSKMDVLPYHIGVLIRRIEELDT